MMLYRICTQHRPDDDTNLLRLEAETALHLLNGENGLYLDDSHVLDLVDSEGVLVLDYRNPDSLTMFLIILCLVHVELSRYHNSRCMESFQFLTDAIRDFGESSMLLFSNKGGVNGQKKTK